MDKNSYIQLFDAFMAGTISEDEERLLFDWLETDGSDKEIHSLFEERWENSSNTLDEDIQLRMLSNIRSQMDDLPNKKMGRSGRLMRYIAAASILLVIAAGTYLAIGGWMEPTELYVVSTGRAEKKEFSLPDGTKVWLNSESKIVYDNKYNRRSRNLTLEGEAFFDVAKDKKRRFIVTANHLSIEALGTSFNVRSFPEGKDITVSLVEGKLEIDATDKKRFLHPNEQLKFNKKSRKMAVHYWVNTENAGKWRNNELIFNRESLEEIANILTKMYDLKITFASESAKQLTFSGTIKDGRPENALQIISLAAPIKASLENGAIVIRDK